MNGETTKSWVSFTFLIPTDRYNLHSNFTHALVSNEDDSGPFSHGPSTESMFKRSPVRSTFDGVVVVAVTLAGAATSGDTTWVLPVSNFDSEGTCQFINPRLFK